MNRTLWQASYGDIPHDIDPDRYPSVVAMLEGAMQRFADRTAFRSLGHALTYAQVDRLSSAFCAYLQQRLKVRKGDRVAVMLPNIAAFPVACLGIMRAGAVQVNVNPLYTPRELAHQLKDAGCEIIVIFNGSTGVLAEIVGSTPVRHIVTVGLGDALGVEQPGPPVDPRLGEVRALNLALAEGSDLVRIPVPLVGDDPLFLQYTGGTTGLSKGATLTHRNLVANTEQFRVFARDDLREDGEVVVTAIPLYHIFALMVNFISYFSVGGENWLVANPRDINALVEVLKNARPTAFTGVNTLFQGLTMHPGLKEVDWSRGRLFAGGGAAIHQVTSDRWEAITGRFIREGYGLSETSPIVSFVPSTVRAFTGTTGLPMPSTDIRLLDEQGRDVMQGEAGEVCVRGPQVMTGYWNQAEVNRHAFTEDGYFKTGDIGQFDAEGFLRIVDRKKDMIIVSGFNVFPNEVEAVASGCDGVVECACVGVADEKSGEAVVLYVVKAVASSLTVDEVVAWCRARLTAYKVPKTVHFIDALPKSTVGKVLRRDLRNAR